MDNYANAHISVDYERHEIVNRTGEPIDLTPTQWRMVTLFIESKGRVITNEDMRECCRDGQEVVAGTIKYHISALRRQLGDAFLLKTIRSYGYRYDG